jgi:hypothetical protein
MQLNLGGNSISWRPCETAGTGGPLGVEWIRAARNALTHLVTRNVVIGNGVQAHKRRLHLLRQLEYCLYISCNRFL